MESVWVQSITKVCYCVGLKLVFPEKWKKAIQKGLGGRPAVYEIISVNKCFALWRMLAKHSDMSLHLAFRVSVCCDIYPFPRGIKCVPVWLANPAGFYKVLGSCFLSSHSICWMMRGTSQHPHRVLLEDPEQHRGTQSQRSPQRNHPSFGAVTAAAVAHSSLLQYLNPTLSAVLDQMVTKQSHKPQHKYLNSQTIPHQSVILPCTYNARLNFGLQELDFDWKPSYPLRCMGAQIWLRSQTIFSPKSILG